MDVDDDGDGRNLILIFVIIFVFLVVIVVAYIIVAKIYELPPFSADPLRPTGNGRGSNDCPTLCGDADILSPADAYKKYLDGGIVDNPLSLSSMASNSTHTLKLKKLPKTGADCISDGLISVPFPEYCQVFDDYTFVKEYKQEPNQTSTSTRTYADEDDNVLSFRQNCVPVVADAFFYSPATKW